MGAGRKANLAPDRADLIHRTSVKPFLVEQDAAADCLFHHFMEGFFDFAGFFRFFRCNEGFNCFRFKGFHGVVECFFGKRGI